MKNFDVETEEIPKQIFDIVVGNILPDYYWSKEKEKNLIIIAVLFFYRKLFAERKELLKQAGIFLSEQEPLSMYGLLKGDS